MAEQQITTLPPGGDQNLFNGKKLLTRAIDYWYLYVLSLLICLTYAWFKIHYATPMYKVYGQVLVSDDKNNGGSSQALAGNNNGLDFSSLFSGKTNMVNELAIFQTTDLCRKVVKNLKLYITYYHKGNIRSVELYKRSPFRVEYYPRNDSVVPITMQLKFPQKYGSQFTLKTGNQQFRWHFNDTLHYKNADYYFVNTGDGFDTTATYLMTIQNPEAVAVGIAGRLDAELLGTKSTIVNLVYNTNLPQKGVDVLAAIISAYINRNLEQKNITSDSTIQFIDGRIALVGSDLSNIESTIQHFKQENKIADLTEQSQQLISSSAGYYQRLSDIEVQLQVVQTMLSYVQSEQNNRRPVPSLLSSDLIFTSLVNSYNAAQVQRDKILLSLKEDNPITLNTDVQIAGLRGDIIRNLKSQQQALLISKQQLASQNSSVNNQIRNVPAQERKFLDYSREQNVKQALYLFLLQRREEIAIAKASNSSNASIISAPKASYAPYEPNSGTYLTLGLIMGLVFPTIFVVLKDSLNNKVLSREDVTSITSASILAEIGHSATQGILNLEEEGRSIIAEQFRIFRTNMDFTLPPKSSSVIIITSCLSGEGKSFVAANLGQIYAISGKRVLLMELDLRKPKLSKMFDMSSETGFSNFIISDRPIYDFIKPVSKKYSLSLLSSGPVPPNPAELLLSEKTTAMIADLRNQFDIIIIDTAPIGAVTDAQILGKSSDVSLYVIRQGYSIKSSIEIVNDILQNNKLSSLYLVLNDLKAGTSYKYGYGYRYGYGYSYTGETKKIKKRWWNKG